MRWPLFVLLASVVSQLGCNLVRNATHNLLNEPRQHFDDQHVARATRSEAKSAWEQYCAIAPSQSEDFVQGFQDGYADYLDSGGNAQPPAVPPLRYRRSKFSTPSGHMQVQEYMAGIKAGLEAGMLSGRRQFLTVPVLLPNAQTETRLNVQQKSKNETSIASPNPHSQQLPQPRKYDESIGLTVPTRPVISGIPQLNPAPTSPELSPSIPEVTQPIATEPPRLVLPDAQRQEPLPSEPPTQIMKPIAGPSGIVVPPRDAPMRPPVPLRLPGEPE